MEVDFEQAVRTLREGKPLVFPTDTVWGIGVAVAFAEGTSALSEAKGRAESKPIAWLIDDAEAISIYGCDVPDYAHVLAEAFWPGAMTIVVKASSDCFRAGDARTYTQELNARTYTRRIPDSFVANDGTVGLRMPASKQALSLMHAAGSPLAATSANFAGAPSTPASHPSPLDFATESNVPVYGCPETDASNVASTVVDCTNETPKLVRAGTISASEIERVCGLPLHVEPSA